MNDLSPAEYEDIEAVAPGWHQLGELPAGVRFRSNPGNNWKEWVVEDSRAELFGIRQPLVYCLTDPSRRTHSCRSITVWVD